MRKAIIFLFFVFMMGGAGCRVDSRYEAASLLDNQTAEMAQKLTASIENSGIEVKSAKVNLLEFGGSYPEMNVDENRIKPYFTFVSENMFFDPLSPPEINGIILIKMKSKDIIDAEFIITDNETQGICADVQQEIYSETLALLTETEKEKYRTTGKQLAFIKDNNTGTNPVTMGSTWLSVDPADKISFNGNTCYYEPMSLYVTMDDPAFQDGGDERYKGVRYCKLLSHQAILSWLLTKSFQSSPTLITESPIECTGPGTTIPTAGSCIFNFPLAFGSYYCSDYTGSGFTSENAEEKCLSRPAIADGAEMNPVYSPVPCRERTDEIEAAIPGYVGHTGICVAHCQEENEFIWNIYTENPEGSCIGYDLFYPEEL